MVFLLRLIDDYEIPIIIDIIYPYNIDKVLFHMLLRLIDDDKIRTVIENRYGLIIDRTYL